jgi:hypothetical protein
VAGMGDSASMNAACPGWGDVPSIAKSIARSIAFAVGDSEGFTLRAMRRSSHLVEVGRILQRLGQLPP